MALHRRSLDGAQSKLKIEAKAVKVNSNIKNLKSKIF